MDQYSVDIRFPRSDSQNPDLVVISGLTENVDEAKDHILNLAKEYMDDVNEQYRCPPSRQIGVDFDRPSGERLCCKGWSMGTMRTTAVPDTSDAQDSHSFCSEMSSYDEASADDQ
jgi:hypothetical protein